MKTLHCLNFVTETTEKHQSRVVVIERLVARFSDVLTRSFEDGPILS